ncbi:hypothetical protein K501DRAFT_218469 [Backusella circina FSU 941]|nr:hypothetical protein K501DRAFT_256186 [Backusella circina FSU 941]KAI8883984.1 hypothetical protein K501DRAFT_218469 [Backusella circina FSU 941]
MKYFTGDESGLVKWIAFPPQIKEKPRKKKQKTEGEEGEEEKKKETLQPLMGSFGKVNKDRAVQLLEWANLKDQQLLLVARKDGSVEFLDPETGDIVKTFQNKHVGSEKDQGKFVGIFVTNTYLCLCTSTGDLSYTMLRCKDGSETKTVLNLGPDLEIMRGHPTLQNMFAIGGKGRDLCIYDIKKIVKNGDATVETIDSAGPTKNTSPHKKQSERNTGLVFQAKNVKNDFLDLQQPVWIHDLQFMNKEATQVAVATHYHQFRLYDTKKARRPVISTEIGKNPIKSLAVGKDFNHVLFADTMSTAGMIDIRTGKQAALFKGLTGAVTSLITAPTPKFDDDDDSSDKERFVASVSLDRFLRVHEISTIYRNVVDKAYLKQRLTCVLVDEGYEYPVPKVKTEEEELEEEEDAMWEAMEVANDKKRKRN